MDIAVISTLADGNLITGNTIGTDALGSNPLPNHGSGIDADAPGNTIRNNLVSANREDGIRLVGTHAHGNLVTGNTVGLSKGGAAILGNGLEGVEVGGPNNTIGGTAAGTRNVISGNGLRGVAITGVNTTGNLVEGNSIGTDFGARLRLRRETATRESLVYSGASHNTIGGTATGAGNIISGNVGDGVFLADSNTSANVVLGNRIGVNATGSSAMGNGGFGVVIRESPGNTIGGAIAGAGNIIGGNGEAGVRILGQGARGNVVQGNSIGTDSAGQSHLSNKGSGVSIGQGLPAT